MGNDGFRWLKLNEKEIGKFDVNSIECNCTDIYIYIYILEVHLEYPDKLHQMHNDY